MGLYEQNYLMHHGIKGQKWGVQHGPPYPLDSGVSTGSSLRKRGGFVAEMKSDHEHDRKVKTRPQPFNTGNVLTKDEFKNQYIKKCQKIIDDDLKNINPNRYTRKKWSNNCGNCTMASELLAHGITATAKPNSKWTYAEVFEKAFGVEDYNVVISKTEKQYINELKASILNQGKNSSGVISIQWGDLDLAHFIHYTNVNGKITIEDGQAGVSGSLEKMIKQYQLTPTYSEGIGGIDTAGPRYLSEVTRLDNGTPNYDVLSNYVNLRRK